MTKSCRPLFNLASIHSSFHTPCYLPNFTALKAPWISDPKDKLQPKSESNTVELESCHPIIKENNKIGSVRGLDSTEASKENPGSIISYRYNDSKIQMHAHDRSYQFAESYETPLYSTFCGSEQRRKLFHSSTPSKATLLWPGSVKESEKNGKSTFSKVLTRNKNNNVGIANLEPACSSKPRKRRFLINKTTFENRRQHYIRSMVHPQLISSSDSNDIKKINDPECYCSGFESDLVRKQLVDIGLLDVIKMRQLGYPIRIPFDTFIERFVALFPPPCELQELMNNLFRQPESNNYTRQALKDQMTPNCNLSNTQICEEKLKNISPITQIEHNLMGKDTTISKHLASGATSVDLLNDLPVGTSNGVHLSDRNAIETRAFNGQTVSFVSQLNRIITTLNQVVNDVTSSHPNEQKQSFAANEEVEAKQLGRFWLQYYF
ncbi:unnamed protein product [Protopolystoma xenopodis]|uniref:Uncharacterized protein n=1 Tax=Protopolystoma xenopodis TaxID=117903 RepID=A0A448WMD0_9PLAT|nr:unnamed protein product [Protopolystoma xenopodis]